jgi:hypothetical protein
MRASQGTRSPWRACLARTAGGRVTSLAVLLTVSLWGPYARALDKQGSAHGGSVSGENTGFGLSGAVSMGTALYNPTYAARPDNTGHALMRYALHADVDLLGAKLSAPIDLNLFSDRDRRGALAFSPTEFDVIGGLTSTWGLSPSLSLEVGSRIEWDLPVDQAGASQKYIDARGRLLFSLAKLWPSLGSSLVEGDVSGWFTGGAFLYNPSYFARPDNSGKALLRYGPHVELSMLHDWVSFGVDATMFTDRESNGVLPSELDFTPEVIGHWNAWELHLAYERDMPVDRRGAVQHWLFALLVYSFDLGGEPPLPLEGRGSIPSP